MKWTIQAELCQQVVLSLIVASRSQPDMVLGNMDHIAGWVLLGYGCQLVGGLVEEGDICFGMVALQKLPLRCHYHARDYPLGPLCMADYKPPLLPCHFQFSLC